MIIIDVNYDDSGRPLKRSVHPSFRFQELLILLYLSFSLLSEEGIKKDTAKTEDDIRAADPPGVVNDTSNIARRANR